jgi:putative ABC transport system substrate-binding protein
MDMRRRDFITVLGSATASLAVCAGAASAQPAKRRPLVGWLGGSTPKAGARNLSAFLQGLRDHGLEDGVSIDIVYRWAEGDPSRLPVLAGQLIALNPDVILTASPPGNVVLMQSTAAIPIVGALTVEPVKLGLAISHNRPGRNFTGVLTTIDGLPGKQVGLLLQLLPRVSMLGVLMRTDSPTQPFLLHDIESALRSKPIKIVQATASSLDDLPAAFEVLKRARVDAVVVSAEGVIFTEAPRVISLAAEARLPAMYSYREHVQDGGLISYGVDVPQNFRRAAYFVDRIIKGAKPGDLPIELPTKLALVINLKTAKGLGIEVPSTLLFTADEVVE